MCGSGKSLQLTGNKMAENGKSQCCESRPPPRLGSKGLVNYRAERWVNQVGCNRHCRNRINTSTLAPFVLKLCKDWFERNPGGRWGSKSHNLNHVVVDMSLDIMVKKGLNIYIYIMYTENDRRLVNPASCKKQKCDCSLSEIAVWSTVLIHFSLSKEQNMWSSSPPLVKWSSCIC